MPPGELISNIFVYGSLRPEFVNPMSRWLNEHTQRLGDGWIHGRLYDLGNYPGFIECEGAWGYRIAGCVLRARAAELGIVLARLDDYESVDPDSGEYTRKMFKVHMNGLSCLKAWVYVYRQSIEPFPLIECGDYVRYCRQTDPARFKVHPPHQSDL